ncbi:SWIM zinc finger-containing protein [Rivularia sp. PCC 7116]|uniref:SWIM zinc finger family protein n=1 Tax=Rivularia sp. PCC 7116 TaxID=373994 RepID=UPI00029F1270|nr:SWIM zinc finger family protein [Rivularia sp. PCC 7116]AFY58723.1 SWIM zinc finger-containing protein [Rivularia sp. PCC 7116]
MSATWTQEQILALAPDASSAKNGRALATSRKWSSLGCNEKAAWGDCQGSGKNPYRTQIDLTEPAFKCSCPSRKFPCKHGIALFLLLANEKQLFAQDSPPEWVDDWLQARSTRKTKKEEKVKAEEKVNREANPQAQVKRAQKRLNKVTAGMQDLEVWLRDLISNGLAAAQEKPYSFWDESAARLVDAQAPGVARLVKDMGSIAHSGAGWQERLLSQLGRVYLLIAAFKHLETLTVPVQTDIRTQIGFSQNQQELSTQQGVSDLWLILGQSLAAEDRLKIQRTWLWGKATQQKALILNFAHGSQPLDTSLVPGSCINAELVFFESAFPLRAIIKTRQDEATQMDAMPGYSNISNMIQEYSQALAYNPWIEQFPAPTRGVIPIKQNNNWFVRDEDNRLLPLKSRFKNNWQLLALSGGYPLDIFGEWDGECFLPLSVWVDNRFVNC